ncbi:L-threonylcarbamoyladenylate synthase [Saccharicrinis fermentans]|uniref:L-threonylcarbamoyladenylate synthase n=1 Tax=Saccharicrinis fermentans DSM 9555 = JCM 21142 TaxID=869213 RepID=W7Y2S4_9BACT|nr:L-threonylcarbamoyladenylate synthase [Saccharicrinis fermentans]GAF01878.1 t(6)A37 threonylcarbamoyladenosine biosynthesis protein RimN [Saccharicrinis fermentans DSM 9555 = JCM 21142]
MIDDIKRAVEVLQQGGLILYPTDTIWGIGCDATNVEAVKKVYRLKRREDSQSMLVLLDKDAKLNSYVTEVPELAWDLIDLSTKPTTIIYPNAKNLAENLLATDKSIGIRISKEEFSQKLCERFKKPIVSTSANISGEPAPAHFADITADIINGVDYVVGFRQDDNCKAVPSSIIKLEVNGQVKVIRE